MSFSGFWVSRGFVRNNKNFATCREHTEENNNDWRSKLKIFKFILKSGYLCLKEGKKYGFNL